MRRYTHLRQPSSFHFYSDNSRCRFFSIFADEKRLSSSIITLRFPLSFAVLLLLLALCFTNRNLRRATMAAAISVSPLAFVTTTKPSNIKSLRKLPMFTGRGRQMNRGVVAMAIEQESESSSSQSILQYVQTVWDKSEDRLAIAGLGFAAVVAIWASSNLIVTIDKLPFIPSALEFIGIAFSWWFIYRYLLFKPDREELVKIIKNSISEVTGQ